VWILSSDGFAKSRACRTTCRTDAPVSRTVASTIARKRARDGRSRKRSSAITVFTAPNAHADASARFENA
jgi:hypothetical protein